MNSAKRVSCLGVLVVDALSGPLAEYPVPGIRPQVTTPRIRFAAGGGAANTAVCLARMGLAVTAFSKVGRDANGAFLVRELEAGGVDTSGVRLSDTDTTPFTFVGIHPGGERTFIHTPGANLTFGPADVDLEALYACQYLVYQDFWVKPAMDGPPAAELLAEARRRGITTFLDECWGLGPDRDSFELVLPHCDFVMPSADDLRAIYPGLEAEQAARHLLACGAGTAIVKRGALGCLVARGGTCVSVPACRATVVDTTGAGDSWDAGFIAALAHGEPLLAAARTGAAAAAYCIEAIGGDAGVPGYEAVRTRAAGDC
jgi:sugar/nucleoside kinase (ribokinase family)